MTSVRELVHAALRDGDDRGVRFVRERHLPPGRFTDLADATHSYAWEHGVDDGDGWRTFPGGVLGWWATEGDLAREQARRL